MNSVSDNRCIIYVSKDPSDGSIRYVGKTHLSLRQRLAYHLDAALVKLIDRPLCRWLKSLNSEGLKSAIEEVETVAGKDGPARELHWFNEFRAKNNLLNAAKPGAGPAGGWRRIDWTLDLDALLGTQSDEDIAKIVGRTRKAVSYRRESLGIQPKDNFSAAKQRGKPRPKAQITNIPAEALELLGKLADRKLAAQFGLTRSVIRTASRRKGLSSVNGILTALAFRDGVAERLATATRKANAT